MERFLAFVAGAIIGIILLVVLSRKRGEGCIYDERQIAARGKAFKYGFFTFLIYFIFYGGQLVITQVELVENYIAIVTGCCLAVFVFVTCAIWNDAYFSFKDKTLVYVLIFLVVGILNLVISVGEYIETGSFGYAVINLSFGILFLLIDLVFGLKKIKDRGQE